MRGDKHLMKEIKLLKMMKKEWLIIKMSWNLKKLSSQKNIDNIEKEYDERNRMDMSDDKECDEIYQIGENDEEMVTDDIEVLKLGKWLRRKIQKI